MSVERRQLMEVYGAEFVLTPKEKGMKGAIEKAMEMVAENPKAWSPRQFDNSINVKAHMQTTAMELIEDFRRRNRLSCYRCRNRWTYYRCCKSFERKISCAKSLCCRASTISCFVSRGTMTTSITRNRSRI